MRSRSEEYFGGCHSLAIIKRGDAIVFSWWEVFRVMIDVSWKIIGFTMSLDRWMMNNKGERKADEPGQGSSSKRIPTRRQKSKTPAMPKNSHDAISDTQLEIRISHRTLVSCGLTDPTVLVVPGTDFAKRNLLYDIMRGLFECEGLELYKQIGKLNQRMMKDGST